MNKKKVAIDMTWIRHEKVGGTEFYAVNLLEGFVAVNDPNILYYVLIAENNYRIFVKYKTAENIRIIRCRLNSENKWKRVVWQNMVMDRIMRELDTGICIEPVYLKPFLSSNKIKYITTVHDLQAVHYPEYFNKARVGWMKLGWFHAIYTSKIIVVTSEFVKNDILLRYHIDEDKICINYDPVTINKAELAPESRLKEYGAEKGKYYYMCSSMAPHENIETVIKALGKLKKSNSRGFFPLFISGIGGKRNTKIRKLAEKCGILKELHLLPFIPNEDRNLFYKNCRAFLAPSLFEGFGMPPIEAMIMGAPVITTMETCSYEITRGLAVYVKDAKNVEQWCNELEKQMHLPDMAAVKKLAKEYSKESIAACYNNLIKKINKGTCGGA